MNIPHTVSAEMVMEIETLKHTIFARPPVAHTCNPRYTGGSDQEDCGSKGAPSKYFRGPYLEKNPSPKTAGGLFQAVRAPA
jgi:hypothetical protein